PFPDQPLMPGWYKCPLHRQFPSLDNRHVSLEFVLILVMNALQMSEGRNANRQNVAPAEQVVSIDEMIGIKILDQLVSAGELIPGSQEPVDRFIGPPPLGLPVSHG